MVTQPVLGLQFAAVGTERYCFYLSTLPFRWRRSLVNSSVRRTYWPNAVGGEVRQRGRGLGKINRRCFMAGFRDSPRRPQQLASAFICFYLSTRRKKLLQLWHLNRQ